MFHLSVDSFFVRGIQPPGGSNRADDAKDDQVFNQWFHLRVVFDVFSPVRGAFFTSSLFYISGAGIVGGYMTTTAWMARK